MTNAEYTHGLSEISGVSRIFQREGGGQFKKRDYIFCGLSKKVYRDCKPKNHIPGGGHRPNCLKNPKGGEHRPILPAESTLLPEI